MPFTSPLQIELQDVRATSVGQQHMLGMVAYTGDGRQFRYGQGGAVALVAGQLQQIPAVISTHQAVAVAVAAPTGSVKVTVTLGATNPTTADQYRDGYLVIRDTSALGAGQAFPITGNSAALAATSCDVYIGEGVQEPLTTSSVANLELSPYRGTLVSTSGDTTERVVGVPQVDVPIGYFAWYQTTGVSSVLGNGTITKGAGLIKSATTAGAVDIEATGTITQRVGMALQTGTTTKYNTVYLSIV